MTVASGYNRRLLTFPSFATEPPSVMPTVIFRVRRCLLALVVAGLAACATHPTIPVQTPAAPGSAGAPAVFARAPIVALALGGGAARGFAHVGVIKALESRGIVPDIIVGTSAGSVVGALYASGMNGFDLNKVAMTMDESSVSDWALPTRGLFRGVALQDFVNRSVGNRPIEALTRRFAATATDLRTGELIVFERGNVGQAVRASSAVPGVFEPVRIGNREYVDGGLVTPVPVRVARKLGADVVIAVDIGARPEVNDPTGLFSALLQTFAIMGRSIARMELADADVVIAPELGAIGSTDFAARNASVLAGEQAALREADRIRALIEKKRHDLAGF